MTKSAGGLGHKRVQDEAYMESFSSSWLNLGGLDKLKSAKGGFGLRVWRLVFAFFLFFFFFARVCETAATVHVLFNEQ